MPPELSLFDCPTLGLWLPSGLCQSQQYPISSTKKGPSWVGSRPDLLVLFSHCTAVPITLCDGVTQSFTSVGVMHAFFQEGQVCKREREQGVWKEGAL